MTDHLSKSKRSWNMSRIKSKDTKPEIIVRKYLYKKGLRYRIHSKSIPGRPDISIKKYKIAIFVHGCFWHGHKNCDVFRFPKSNVDYWKTKVRKNKQRDSNIEKELKKNNWTIIKIWECQLEKNRGEKLYHIYKKIRKKIKQSK